jgi:hypothetical protein
LKTYSSLSRLSEAALQGRAEIGRVIGQELLVDDKSSCFITHQNGRELGITDPATRQ